MPKIALNLNKKLFTDKMYPYLMDHSHRYEVYLGSAGSGKSYFITQKIIVRCCTESIRILVCRRYGTTLRQTVFALFKDILKKWKLFNYVKVNESDYRITFPNGSEIIFTGLDEETKLLSLTNISTVWAEEAYEIPQSMFEQLDLRMRGKAQNQQLILSLNPINKSSWIYSLVTNPPDNLLYIHSTYKDNPHLSKEYVDSIESLQTRNPAKWKIYGLGEWGTDTEGLVFTNWRTDYLDKMELAKHFEHRCGMDLGFADPSAIIESFYDKTNHRIYITSEFYKTGQQLSDVVAAIKDMQLTKCKIQCDSAEPRSIDYFKRQNIYAVPCIKGQNSVKSRIMFLQDNELIVDKNCLNIITELENFSYEFDKSTGRYIDDKYTHQWSHAIDALGYGYSDVYHQSKLKTIEKGVLGL